MREGRLSAVVFPARVRPGDVASVIPLVAAYLRIAHQIPGRIRFTIDPAVLTDPALRDLGDQGLSETLGVIRGVRDIRINRLARSCIIEYDKAIIADHAWGDLLAERATPAAHALLGIIEDKYEEVRRGQL